MLAHASDFQLSWVTRHAEWILAAARLGTRDFAQADRWLQRVERAAIRLDDPLISINAAVLRARFLLALQRAEQASEALMVDDSRPVNPAMRAELIAMKAFTAAVLGDFEQAELGAKRAAAMTTAVEVRAYVATTYAVCRPTGAQGCRCLLDCEGTRHLGSTCLVDAGPSSTTRALGTDRRAAVHSCKLFCVVAMISISRDVRQFRSARARELGAHFSHRGSVKYSSSSAKG